MLTKNALQLFTRPEKHVGDVFILRCLIHQEMTVARFDSVRERNEVVEHVKQKMLVDLWYHLYGDVIKSIPPLKMEAMMTMNPLHRFQGNPVETGFDNLMKMLKPPVDWMNDMEARMQKPRTDFSA